MYTLYYSKGACSLAVHAVLNHLGVEFRLENMSDGGNRSPQFLKINPLGQVPVLATPDGRYLREGAAILLHLLDSQPNDLLPRTGLERDHAIEALMFCNSTLHPAYGRCFFFMKTISDENIKKYMLGLGAESINKLWKDVELRLENSQFLAGDKITVADILMAVIANWSPRIDGVKVGERAKKLFAEVVKLPAFQKALQVEQVEYQMA